MKPKTRGSEKIHFIFTKSLTTLYIPRHHLGFLTSFHQPFPPAPWYLAIYSFTTSLQDQLNINGKVLLLKTHFNNASLWIKWSILKLVRNLYSQGKPGGDLPKYSPVEDHAMIQTVRISSQQSLNREIRQISTYVQREAAEKVALSQWVHFITVGTHLS